MPEKRGLPLADIPGFPEPVARKLAQLWITTAEELVGAAIREDGPQGLAEYLDLPEDDVVALVEQAQAALPPQVFFAPGDVERRGMGALDEPEDEEPDPALAAFAPLPAQIDLHDRFPSVRDQGDRGTCVAFACTAVREYLLGPESARGDLAEQFVYWDCKQRDNFPGSGTWISVGMSVLRDHGVCTEVVWPYNPQPIPGNEAQGPPPSGALEKATDHRITDSERLRARWVDALRQVLADGRPVAFAVPVYTYWFAPPARTTGDIRLPLSTDHREGGHAMCMVGYEDDPDVPGGGYFLVRNSWGTDWAGDNALAPGHCRMPYAYLEQLASSAYTAFVAAPPEEEKPGSVADWLHSLWGRLFG
jgi:hypothetical protein